MLAAAPSSDVSEVRFAFQHSDDQRLLSLLLHAPRYAQIMFIDFSRLLCSDGQHFTVLTLTIGSACLPAYRGPDNTLIGWKEDLAFKLTALYCLAAGSAALFAPSGTGTPRVLSVRCHSKDGSTDNEKMASVHDSCPT